MRRIAGGSGRRGATLVEFSLVAFLMMLVVFACIEFDRMLLVYNSVANAARAGCRYAVTHGNTTSDSTHPATLDQITTVVKNFAGSAPLNLSNITVTVTPTAPVGAPGTPIKVTVTYPYDPFTVLPLTVSLSSTSEGVITF